jgi:hypothetical protein
MRKSDSSYTGHVSRVIELFQGKWTIQILCAMRERPVRLSELKRKIPLASKNALTAALRSARAQSGNQEDSRRRPLAGQTRSLIGNYAGQHILRPSRMAFTRRC